MAAPFQPSVTGGITVDVSAPAAGAVFAGPFRRTLSAKGVLLCAGDIGYLCAVIAVSEA